MTEVIQIPQIPQKLSSVYIHFPYCLHLCNYCDFYKVSTLKDTREVPPDFHSYLLSSKRLHEKLLSDNNFLYGTLGTVYIGGGTPSLWGEKGAVFLRSYLKSLMNSDELIFEDEYEFTMEMNPGAMTEEGLNAWLDIGLNRLSIGIQAMDQRFLSLLDRIHTLEESILLLEKLQTLDINYSVDLMLGLPKSKEYKRNIISELEAVLRYSPKHISLYVLTPQFSNYQLFQSLPTEEWIEREYLLASEFLQSIGFDHYEVSNFAKKGFESQHNLMYWKSKPIGAFGPGATGFLPSLDRRSAARYKWGEKKVSDCPDYSLEVLDEAQFNLEKFYLLLRTNTGINPKQYFRADDELSKFMNCAKNWQERGWAKSIEPRVILSAKGFLLLDSLMGELFSKTKTL